MKKLLGMLLFLVVSLLIMMILYKNGLFAGINGSALLGIFLTVASLLLVLFIWFAFDNSTRRGLFFILNKKNYLQTMAIIRKERLTNISYNGSESGYGGYRQRQYIKINKEIGMKKFTPQEWRNRNLLPSYIGK